MKSKNELKSEPNQARFWVRVWTKLSQKCTWSLKEMDWLDSNIDLKSGRILAKIE
jgi:hypothetical protein